MHVVIAGASGLIGSAVQPFLRAQGMQVTALDREKPFEPQLRGADIVINLAGENISQGRWTEAKKRRIRDSRVQTTQAIVKALREMDRPPKLLINASAVGYYGNCGDQPLQEDSPAGTGFLASVCQEWEAAAHKATLAGVRVVIVRFGVVLSPEGGALKAMLMPFKMGLGGVIGSGEQWISWISLEDVPPIFQHIIEQADISGPVNVVSPTPLRNEAFTKQLGQLLHRPTVVPLPAFGARLIFGEMADEALLSSVRAIPGVLERTGYAFKHNTLGPWLVEAPAGERCH
jgi:uncharacterized protein (TIGR01777 family)